MPIPRPISKQAKFSQTTRTYSYGSKAPLLQTEEAAEDIIIGGMKPWDSL